MNVVGKVGSLITQGVYSVATPFHPFGGAVDIIVVQQQDGSYRSTPWYVRFGKFQGVLKGAEKVVRIEVNGTEANFHMYIDNSGEAYFVREVVPEKNGDLKGVLQNSDSNNGKEEGRDHNMDTDTNGKDDTLSRLESYDSSTGEFQLRDEHVALGVDRLERTESDGERRFYDFPDVHSSFGSSDLSEYSSDRYDNLDMDHVIESENLSSEVVLVSVDGHILTAPISSSEKNAEDVEDTPQFHLGPGEGTEEFINGENSWATDDYFGKIDTSVDTVNVLDTGKMTDSNAEPQLEHQQDGGCQSEVDRIPDSEKQLTEEHRSCDLENTSPRTNREDASLDDGSPPRMNKEDVFKSCLELPALTMQVGNVSSHDADSPKRIPDVAEQSQERSPCGSLSADGTQDRQFTVTEISDKLSSCSSSIPSVVGSPESAVQAETLDKNSLAVGPSGSDSMIDDFNYTNGKPENEVEAAPQESASEAEALANDDVERPTTTFCEGNESDTRRGLEISLCRNSLHPGMGSAAAEETFGRHRISEEEFKSSAASIVKNENLVIRIQGKYLPWDKAAPIILGMVAYGLELSVSSNDAIPVEQEATIKTGEDETGINSTPSGRGWRLWPIPFRRGKSIDHTSSNASNEEVFIDSESGAQNRPAEPTSSPGGARESPRKQLMRTNVPTSEQIASLNLKEGQNMVTFISFSRVLGAQKVEAHIYLWKWNARIVISDVDGTITKSDVLGQFMPLVGKDWTHSGIARLFSAIKGNGYQLLFLSARAIVQAYLTKTFLFNLKQDGKTLPNGPVVISPDGLFPSLYREVIRRAPHEFKIACLEDIKSLFPPEHNPFYAGFGNRDTDELSYRKIGIPKGKIFIINPKGEVAINNRIDVKSYTSLHTLVHDMFPPTSMAEQEDYNSWNYWRMPLPDIDG
ncbi:OLC1v1034728C1 [Oldenlandia corymbosa var. corymbosa]|uniref:phosphatidate phosphatase n=1 Tax=Oldenlandia corymbosa var. corymbosa TaxID=529605 RepID=A0AAV1CSJ3_OLDCO|nr:OLC1v1034728C1 [Oldenlandia corymbosa var. corymbosa]